jgi:hypothetical protein
MDAKQLIAAARRQTGLESLGDDAILEGLNQLVDALNREAKLSERGERNMEGIIVGTLANRLRVENHLAEHPDLLERPIDRPLFVFGLPRTGTTLAINLLNEDPGRRSLLRWEAFNSVPPPKAGELSSDPRCLTEQAKLDMSLKYMPHISAIHHEDADSPTECQFAMAPSFCAQYFEAIAEIPSYGAWFLQADYLPAFRYHKRLLQLLQSAAPGRWTLKNPWHPLFLDALTTVYPDAQLVMTHRDPVEVVGSACSLIRHVRPMFSDHVDLERIAKTMLNTFDRMIERTVAYLDRRGPDSIHHLHYDALMRDPMGEMRKLYARFDEPFTPAAESAMKALLAGNPKGKHGRHVYSLEEFGLTEAQVREHFRDYCERFAIPQRT